MDGNDQTPASSVGSLVVVLPALPTTHLTLEGASEAQAKLDSDSTPNITLCPGRDPLGNNQEAPSGTKESSRQDRDVVDQANLPEVSSPAAIVKSEEKGQVVSDLTGGTSDTNLPSPKEEPKDVALPDATDEVAKDVAPSILPKKPPPKHTNRHPDFNDADLECKVQKMSLDRLRDPHAAFSRCLLDVVFARFEDDTLNTQGETAKEEKVEESREAPKDSTPDQLKDTGIKNNNSGKQISVKKDEIAETQSRTKKPKDVSHEDPQLPNSSGHAIERIRINSKALLQEIEDATHGSITLRYHFCILVPPFKILLELFDVLSNRLLELEKEQTGLVEEEEMP